MKNIVFIALALFISSISFSQKDVPDMTLKDMDGKNVELKDYIDNDKIVVISFWATWCSPCKKELTNIYELLPDWEDDYNVKLIGISIDDAQNALKVKPYVNGKGWDFDVLVDVNQDTKRVFNFNNIPFTAIIKDGKIVWTHAGYVEGDEYELEDEIAKLAK